MFDAEKWGMRRCADHAALEFMPMKQVRPCHKSSLRDVLEIRVT